MLDEDEAEHGNYQEKDDQADYYGHDEHDDLKVVVLDEGIDGEDRSANLSLYQQNDDADGEISQPNE